MLFFFCGGVASCFGISTLITNAFCCKIGETDYEDLFYEAPRAVVWST